MSIPWLEIKNSTKPEPVYTHVLPDGAGVIHFATRRLRESVRVKLVPIKMYPVSLEVGTALLEMNVVEPLKLASLVKINPRSYRPLLLMAHHDGSSSIIDGHEEYCAAAAQSFPEVPGRRLPISVWEEYTIRGIPYSDAQIKSLVDTQLIHNKLKPN